MEEAIFGRRDSLQRTPPGLHRQLCPVEQEAHEEVPVEERIQASRCRIKSCPERRSVEVSKAAKRPRDEGEVDSRIQHLRKEVERMTRTIGELVTVTEASSKTKVEIKALVQRLKRQVTDVNKEWEALDGDEDKLKCTTEVKEMKTVATQADEQDIVNEHEQKRKRTVNKILSTLEGDGDFSSLAKVLAEKWPQEVYKVTEIDQRDPANLIGREGDYAVLIDPKTTGINKLVEKLKVKYNGLDELINNNEAQIDFVIQSAKSRTRNSDFEETNSAVYYMPMSIDQAGVNDMEMVHSRIKELMEVSKVHPTGVINMVIGVGLKVGYVRKICEYVFGKENTRIKLMVQGIRSDPRKPKMRKEESIVTVKAEGKNYSDIVKKLRENVDIEKIGVRIGKVRKTGKGDLQLVVEGGQNMADTLQKEIKSKVENISVAAKTMRTTTLYIIGMDPVTREEEVKQAITRDTKLQESDIRILAMRKGKYEDQTAIVEVPKDRGATLIKQKEIRVGWLDCGVRERIYIPRCYKCLEHGHKTHECTAKTDRSGQCFRCGQTGHKSRECKNGPRCVECGVGGHRGDQIRCPHFKKIVEKKRKEKIALLSTKARGDTRDINGP